MTNSGVNRTKAAVLVGIYRDRNRDLRVILIRRTAGGIHGGQLAFPGGKHEPIDASILETALREAEEEIGLAMERVRILEVLPIVETLTSNFEIHPFLASIDPPPVWNLQRREISEVMDVRLTDLAHPDAQGQELMQFANWPNPRRVPCLRVGSYRIWGATYRILTPLIPRLLAGY